ncbi:MAG: CRTAC1 family protein, partial [Planctomycetota bacterium]
MIARLLLAAQASDAAPPRFVEVTAEAGVRTVATCGRPHKPYIVDSIGTGVALFDADGDGDLELYFPNGWRAGGYPPGEEPLPAFHRNEGGMRFSERAREAGLARPGWWQGCAVGDVDGDGRPELYVTAFGPHAFFRGDGEGAFADRTAAAGLGDPRWGTSAAFADLDRDGDVDLFVATYIRYRPASRLDPDGADWCDFQGLRAYCGPQNFPGEEDLLYRNEGDGTFTEVGASCGLHQGADSKGLGVVPADLDADGDPDLYVANDTARNFLFLNRGDGVFAEDGVFRGAGYDAEGNARAGMGVDAGDFDGDGDLDLFVTNLDQESSSLFRNLGAAEFEEASVSLGLEGPSFPVVGWGTRFFDPDGDGDLDLLSANGHIYPQADGVVGRAYAQPLHLYRNERRRFVESAASFGADLGRARVARGAGIGDLDEDGDADLVVTVMDGVPSVLRNDGGDAPGWIRLLLRGRRSNREGTGARIELRAGGRLQVAEARASGSFLSSGDPRPLFGLGGADRVEALLVR